VQVEVEDGLAGAAAVVEDGAVAIEDLALASELRSDELELAKKTLVGDGGVGKGLEMLAGTDKDVRGGLGMDVFEGEDLGVFIDNPGGGFFATDFAEDTVVGHEGASKE
jgi:hypothetical protein